MAENTKLIPLTQDKFAIVDVEDYDMLMQWKWMAKFDGYNWYARRNQYGFGNGKSKTILMHRLILGITDATIMVDHKDGNGLNNSRSNIRICTPQQNTFNRRKQTNTTSKFYGVYLDRGYWNAGIKHNGKRKNLGNYPTEEDAAKAYDAEAKKLFGEFATINFK